MTLQEIASKFNDLEFDEVKHLYYVKGEKYPSVSSLVEKHAVKPDFDAILPHYAKKNNLTEEEVKTSWRSKRDIACDLGHETHHFLEHYNGLQEPKNNHEKAGVKFIEELSTEYIVAFKEFRAYSKKYKFAGTMDLPLYHKPTGTFTIADYKTNGDLFKNYKGQTLKAPFDFLEDHPYNKYQLQLSYYDLLLSEIGIPIRERILVYLRADGTYTIYPTQDFKQDLIDYMNTKETEPKYLW